MLFMGKCNDISDFKTIFGPHVLVCSQVRYCLSAELYGRLDQSGLLWTLPYLGELRGRIDNRQPYIPLSKEVIAKL